MLACVNNLLDIMKAKFSYLYNVLQARLSLAWKVTLALSQAFVYLSIMENLYLFPDRKMDQSGYGFLTTGTLSWDKIDLIQ